MKDSIWHHLFVTNKTALRTKILFSSLSCVVMISSFFNILVIHR